jgi:DnaJ-class molecular chaperone
LLLPAALAIVRQPSHAASASEEERQQLKKACRQLRLALHPDKTPKQLAIKQGVFVEAFRALQDAQDKVPCLKA